MKKLLLWLIAWGFCLQSPGQVTAPVINPKAQKYAALLNPENARQHLTILASDDFEGRETGKPGAEKAANYLAAEFKKLGLIAPVNGSYFQNVPLVESSFVVNSFTVNQSSLTNWRDFYFTANAGGVRTVDAKEIVFVGYGISDPAYDDLKDIDIKGKVVLAITNGEPVKDGVSAITKTTERSEWTRNRSMRLQFLQSKKPALILSVSYEVGMALPINLGNGPRPRMSLKSDLPAADPDPSAPVVNIPIYVANLFLKNSGKTYESLKTQIDNNFKPQTQTIKADFSTVFGTKITDVNAMNVLGFMEGSDLKDEVLVVSAHYDHIGLNINGPDKVNNGADDDGSGTTAVLEIARAFANAKKEGDGPRRSILFLGNTGEEKGLLGSEWYTDNPVFPLAKTITNLNIDMIGRADADHKADSNYCYLIGSDKLSTDLHKISEETNMLYTKLKIDYKYNDPQDPEQIYYRSDHYNFAKHKIPVIFYFSGVHEDYHKPGDEVSKIDFKLLTRRTQLIFHTGWELANRDKRPQVDVVNNMPEKR